MSSFSATKRAEIKKIADVVRSNPLVVRTLIHRLPELIQHADPLDLYSIYIRLISSFLNDPHCDLIQLNKIKERFNTMLFRRVSFVFQAQLSRDEFISGGFLYLIMAAASVAHEDNRDIEFDNMALSIQQMQHEIVIEPSLNTPLILSIEKSNLACFHKLMDAVVRAGALCSVNIDAHCKKNSLGSALLLACIKGEEHLGTDKKKSANPLDLMGSAIVKLLDCGSSPTDIRDSTEGVQSPLEVVILRRSPLLLKLMLEHLHAPLTVHQLERVNNYLEKPSYAEMRMELLKLIPESGCTFPLEDEWAGHMSEIVIILSEYKLHNVVVDYPGKNI